MIRKIIILLMVAAVATATAQTSSFARGADVSWCSEMEHDGMKFYNAQGEETEFFALMKQIGLNAIRLRVWVNPSNGYGPWSDKADVLVKARRAHAQGLDLMIDFHYSDYFADPGKQTKPDDWVGMSFDEFKAALAAHTVDVLQALKAEGIEPRWVQVGNETTSGMVWDDGRIDWNKPDNERWLSYVALSNAGYDAVKSVLPDAMVIVHHDNAVYDNVWYYQAFKQYGGKFDMIGLSHYPDWERWSETNTTAAANLKKLYNQFRVPVMIVETGYSTWDEPRAEQVMKDLFEKMTREEGCAGILYWEPEVYGGWDARQLLEDGTWQDGTSGTYGVKVVNHGAFTAYGQPAPALLVFGNDASGLIEVNHDSDGLGRQFNLQGMPVDHQAKGVIITTNGNQARKMLRR